ncbi:MAG TPA: hypothetical protein VIX19_21090 [Terriglobales bacterium]
MSTKRWNWQLWVGFVLAGLALSMYLSLFADHRSIFWPSLALVVIALVLLISGVGRAWGQRELYRGRIAAPILAILGLLVVGVFGWVSYEVFTKTPAARLAPQIGQKAPEFALTDSTGATVTLAQVLATPIADASGTTRPPKGALVVFYRGYW